MLFTCWLIFFGTIKNVVEIEVKIIIWSVMEHEEKFNWSMENFPPPTCIFKVKIFGLCLKKKKKRNK
jgi:hypothetical protein